MSFHWGLHHKTHMFDHFNILLWWVGRNLIAKIGIHLEISFKKNNPLPLPQVSNAQLMEKLMKILKLPMDFKDNINMKILQTDTSICSCCPRWRP